MKKALTFAGSVLGLTKRQPSNNNGDPESLEDGPIATQLADETIGTNADRSMNETKSSPIDIPGANAKQSMFRGNEEDDFPRYW